ncbi:MAG: IS6 family transposase, partial [Pseudonocardiaceae bacterium]
MSCPGGTHVIGQRVQVGLRYAGQIVTIEVDETTLRVYDHHDHLIKTVPRSSRREVTRHKAYGHTTNGSVALADDVLGQAELMGRRHRRVPPPRSSFAGFRFPDEVIMLAVRWYPRYGLSYRDVEELLSERGIHVDVVYRWVQRFTPLLIDAAQPCWHGPRRSLVRRRNVRQNRRAAGVYLYRAIDQFGQVIDVLVAEKRDLAATRRFFTRALEHSPRPAEVSTDQASTYPRVLDELLPSACHITEQYANNAVETDHGRLKARLRPMRGLKHVRSARVISAGHAFVQNLRRGHYEL